jgi:carbon-monoxide dehydrogenase medium subunit
MYASPFQYHRAGSIAEARQLLAAHPGAKLLAGGHSLLPLMKLRLANPEALIDIGSIAELKGITATQDGFRIGAATPHAAIAASSHLATGCAVVNDTAGRIGDPAVRNRGTIGGSLAHADPGADLPGVLVAIGASIEVIGAAGTRTIAADDFFQGLMTTALDEGDIVTAIRVRRLKKGEGAAYAKFPHPASRYAVIGAAACIALEKGVCTSGRVVVSGLLPRPTVLSSVEKALVGAKLDEAAIAAASGRAGEDLGGDIIGDSFASAGYRRGVVGVYVARAVREAARRAG